ncbi:hypothetical protein [Streptomyces acidiscabies]|uniref:Uncharacterized protein n=1 Tax=Streptomyces acidiscabies TaxID=42234 RepID=A0ABU4LWJ9_9ACTN|nr:hypothetical protein [Streptomyces acidiscabies]MDX3020105.1 hypothetical protein [Streptomyces acidiscabies]
MEQRDRAVLAGLSRIRNYLTWFESRDDFNEIWSRRHERATLLTRLREGEITTETDEERAMVRRFKEMCEQHRKMVY